MCTQTMTSTTRGNTNFDGRAVGPVILPTGSCVRCSWPWPLEWQDRTESDNIAQREELHALRFTWRCTARGRTSGLAKPLRLEIEAYAGRHSLRLLVHFEWIGCHWALRGRAAVCGAERASQVGRVEGSSGGVIGSRAGSAWGWRIRPARTSGKLYSRRFGWVLDSCGGGAPPELHRSPALRERKCVGKAGGGGGRGVGVVRRPGSSFSLMG
ncbi:hypothetical protein B0H13DRAFT_2005407, partial [Mycena leptocephala]